MVLDCIVSGTLPLPYFARCNKGKMRLRKFLPEILPLNRARPRGYKPLGQSQTQNKAQ